MKCPNCGTEFEGNICPNCNTDVNTIETEPTPDKSEEVVHDQQGFEFVDSEPMKTKKKKPIRLILEIVGGVFLLFFVFALAGMVPKTDYEKLKNDYNKLSKANEENETKISELQVIESEYADYKKRMEPYETLETSEAEARKIEAERIAAEKKAAEEKAAADKKAAEEKAAADAAAAKAAEEARGYETGITYDQLARTPDQFIAQKVKFYGKVIQVMENTDTIQIRMAVNDDYDTIMFAEYSSSIVTSRVLEDDYITIYGTSVGTVSYQSTMGGTITIPGVSIDKIDQ